MKFPVQELFRADASGSSNRRAPDRYFAAAAGRGFGQRRNDRQWRGTEQPLQRRDVGVESREAGVHLAADPAGERAAATVRYGLERQASMVEAAEPQADHQHDAQAETLRKVAQESVRVQRHPPAAGALDDGELGARPSRARTSRQGRPATGARLPPRPPGGVRPPVRSNTDWSVRTEARPNSRRPAPGRLHCAARFRTARPRSPRA